jgi:hypothetical protein
MLEQMLEPVLRSWTTRRDEKRRRMQLVQRWMKGPIPPLRESSTLLKLSSSVATGLSLKETTKNRLISFHAPWYRSMRRRFTICIL